MGRRINVSLFWPLSIVVLDVLRATVCVLDGRLPTYRVSDTPHLAVFASLRYFRGGRGGSLRGRSLRRGDFSAPLVLAGDRDQQYPHYASGDTESYQLSESILFHLFIL